MICFDSISTMARTQRHGVGVTPVWFTTRTPALVQSFTFTVSKPAPPVDTTSKLGARASSSAWA
jgi:hypothetical protein